ncbi:MAG: peptidylprolyl isomerase [Enterobacterales bacterium]|nr:peptidylprolyl isomerase [Enterobacterales bacterium]
MTQIKIFIDNLNVDQSKVDWQYGGIPKPPLLDFASNSEYFWHLQTNQGEIVIKLKPKESPMHVSSTIYLTLIGFYDGLTFHRVIPGFMAQGGDPLGNGVGGPGYTYMGEFDSGLSHDKPGVLSMANAGAGTDGSQFFITFKAVAFLDGRHSIFGEVVEGMANLTLIEQLGSRSGKPQKPIVIQKATIEVR